MTDLPGRVVGSAGVALQGLEALQGKPKTWGEAANLLRNMMAGVAGTFGGRTGALFASRNDLANFVIAGAKKDKAGMASAGASYLSTMLTLFRATTPLGIAISAQQSAFSLAAMTEKNNPGAWATFKQDPTFYAHVQTGQNQFL